MKLIGKSVKKYIIKYMKSNGKIDVTLSNLVYFSNL